MVAFNGVFSEFWQVGIVSKISCLWLLRWDSFIRLKFNDCCSFYRCCRSFDRTTLLNETVLMETVSLQEFCETEVIYASHKIMLFSVCYLSALAIVMYCTTSTLKKANWNINLLYYFFSYCMTDDLFCCAFKFFSLT